MNLKQHIMSRVLVKLATNTPQLEPVAPVAAPGTTPAPVTPPAATPPVAAQPKQPELGLPDTIKPFTPEAAGVKPVQPATAQPAQPAQPAAPAGNSNTFGNLWQGVRARAFDAGSSVADRLNIPGAKAGIQLMRDNINKDSMRDAGRQQITSAGDAMIADTNAKKFSPTDTSPEAVAARNAQATTAKAATEVRAAEQQKISTIASSLQQFDTPEAAMAFAKQHGIPFDEKNPADMRDPNKFEAFYRTHTAKLAVDETIPKVQAALAQQPKDQQGIMSFLQANPMLIALPIALVGLLSGNKAGQVIGLLAAGVGAYGAYKAYNNVTNPEAAKGLIAAQEAAADTGGDPAKVQAIWADFDKKYPSYRTDINMLQSVTGQDMTRSYLSDQINAARQWKPQAEGAAQ